MAKMWAGRTAGVTDPVADDFNSSIRFDSRMYREDITGSMAHAAMLGAQHILPQADADAIIDRCYILDDLDEAARSRSTPRARTSICSSSRCSPRASATSARSCTPPARATIRSRSTCAAVETVARHVVKAELLGFKEPVGVIRRAGERVAADG